MKNICLLIVFLGCIFNVFCQTAYDYNNSGISKFNLNDYKGAIEDYKKAYQLDPAFLEAYYNAGLAWEKLQDWSPAIALLSIYITKGGMNLAEAYFQRGFAKGKLNDYQGEIADYNIAIKIKPYVADIYYNRGMAKYALQDYRGEIEDYNRAIDLNSEYREAYFNRGMAKLRLGQKESGCLDLSKAGELGDENAYPVIKKYCQ